MAYTTHDREIDEKLEKLAAKCNLELADIEDAYPCTFQQTRFLRAELQGTVSYFTAFTFDFELLCCDPVSTKAAVEFYRDQTPILRTRFVQSNGQYLQVVIKTPLSWKLRTNLKSYLDEDSHTPFVLGQDVGWFAWIEEPDGHKYMVWTLNHAIYDETNLSTRIGHHSQKFVRAIKEIDADASHRLWGDHLSPLAKCRFLFPSALDSTVRASDSVSIVSPVKIHPGCVHQQPALTSAAWALILARLSNSEVVFAPHVTSGRFGTRLADAEQVCGPTLCTVPWVIAVDRDKSVSSLLGQITHTRATLLPHEQAGMPEYENITGHTSMETLMNILVSNEVTAEEGSDILHPTGFGRRVQVTYLVAIIAQYTGQDSCTVRAYYSADWISGEKLRSVLTQLVNCVEQISMDLDSTIGHQLDSLDLPESIGRERN